MSDGEHMTGWQPIETAPPGGACVLIAYTEHETGLELRHEMVVAFRCGDQWRMYCGNDNTPLDATHWMPLPAPPGVCMADKPESYTTDPKLHLVPEELSPEMLHAARCCLRASEANIRQAWSLMLTEAWLKYGRGVRANAK